MTGFEYYWLNQIAVGNQNISKRNPHVLGLMRDGMIEHLAGEHFSLTEAGKGTLAKFLAENPTLPTALAENGSGSTEDQG